MAPDPFPSPRGALLDVRHLSIEYHLARERPHRAVDDLSFDVARGEAVGILGESGSGKSTLALALAGLLPLNARVTQGAMMFQGHDLIRGGERRWQEIRGREISIVFQDPASALNPVMRAGDQVAEVVRAHYRFGWRRCRERATELMEEVRLPGAGQLYAAYPHQLSGGQQQRVVIAQALAGGPALLIADEPTSALDTTTQAEILAMLQDLKARRRLALLMITHDPATLSGLADRVLVLSAGKLVEEGSLEQICERPCNPYTQSLFAAIPPDPPAPGATRFPDSE